MEGGLRMTWIFIYYLEYLEDDYWNHKVSSSEVLVVVLLNKEISRFSHRL